MHILQIMNVILKEPQATEGSHGILRYAQNDNKMARQSGNAVLIILLGVALFGALSYTFMRGSQTGQGNLTQQQAKLAAQEIIGYGQALATRVDKLRSRGCGENQFSFANDFWTLNNGTILHPTNHNLESIPECTVFNTDFPAVILQENFYSSGTAAGTTTKVGHARIIRAPLPNVGLDAEEEIVYRSHGIRPEICVEINNLLGVQNPSDSPPTTETSQTGNMYTGQFFARPTWTDPSGVLTGKTAACVQILPANSIMFIQALLIR